jgi:endonuclease YncB( thermonuclease family)
VIRKAFLCCAVIVWLIGIICICSLYSANAAAPAIPGSHGISPSLDVSQGLVLAVKDGDTLAVLMNGQKVNVRLYGIDAPEKTQAFGMAARNYADALVIGKEITVEPLAVDLYGRTVAMVTVDGVILQEAMLRAGFAWVYDAYCKRSECSNWRILQSEALTAKIGLWQDDNPVAPWQYRKQH